MQDYRQYRALSVIVVMDDGTMLGTLDGVGKTTITLKHATYVESGTETPVDGIVIIPGDRINWLQVP